MAVKYYYGGIIRGTKLEREGLSVTNLPLGTLFIESDTSNIYDLASGPVWRLKGGQTIDPTSSPSWLLYKSGSIYKAKSGILGQVPSGANNFANMDLLWVWLKDSANFNQGVDDPTTGGIIQFYKGVFDFADQVVLDNTYGNLFDSGTGSSPHGLVIQGHRMGTIIRFTAPSGSPKDSGFVVNGPIRQTTIRDIDIQLGDYVTNAIRLNNTSGDNLWGLYDNIRIINSTNTVAQAINVTGQRGVYIAGASSNTFHFNNFRNLWLRFIDTGIETSTVATNQNTSFLKFDNIDMWRCLKGIKIGDYGIEHRITGVNHQDFASHLADYTVWVGKYAKYNQITNITADALGDTSTNPDAAAVILDQAAHLNKIGPVTNTGPHAVFDWSGTILNEFINCMGSGYPNYANKRKVGEWIAGYGIGGSNDGAILYGSGLFAGSLAAISNDAANTVDLHHFDNSEGKGVRFTTANVAGARIGIRGNSYLTQRQHYPLFTARFRIGQVDTDQRFWLLLAGTSTANILPTIPTANGYVTGQSCIGLCFRSTGSGTTFEWLNNDNTGAPGAPDCLWPDDTTIPISVNRQTFNYITNTVGSSTNEAHEVWVFGDQPNGRWLCCLDRGKVQIFSTADQPGAAQNLTPQVFLETTTTANKSFDLYSLKLETLR